MGEEARAEARRTAGGLRARLPESWREVADNATRNHTLTLAAGLAFFGIISIGPAIGFAFGVLRIVTSPEQAETLVDLLEDGFPEMLGFSSLLEQMEDRAGRYAGAGLALLLWPATTLASGWSRGLDAVEGNDSGGGRGLRGRVKGLVPGALIVAGMLLLVGATVLSAATAGGEQYVLVAVLVAAAVGLQFGFCVLVYRILPTSRRPVGELWPGAVFATAGVVVATTGFGAAMTLGEGLADQYPPALATAVVLGLWLYAANIALLLGAEYNVTRARQRAGR